MCSVGRPVNSLFVSPAVTPIKHVTEPYSNNPSFRMYQYDSKDYAVLVRNATFIGLLRTEVHVGR